MTFLQKIRAYGALTLLFWAVFFGGVAIGIPLESVEMAIDTYNVMVWVYLPVVVAVALIGASVATLAAAEHYGIPLPEWLPLLPEGIVKD